MFWGVDVEVASRRSSLDFYKIDILLGMVMIFGCRDGGIVYRYGRVCG